MTTNLQLTTWTLKPDVVARSVGNEMVLLDLETGLYHSLNAVAATIYGRMMRGSASVEDLVEAVASDYDADAEVVRAEVEAFLTAEQDAGLVLAS